MIKFGGKGVVRGVSPTNIPTHKHLPDNSVILQTVNAEWETSLEEIVYLSYL